MQEFNEKLASFIGIVLGDGYIYSKNGGHEIVISSHSEDDVQFLKDYVDPLAQYLFNKIPKYLIDKKAKNIKLRIQSKDAVDLIINSGLKPGNKILNNTTIPKWIFKNKDFLRNCIRGIIDTDGSVFPKSTNKNTPQIEVSSRIPKLREDFRKGLMILGFKPSNWSKGSNTPNCGLYAKDQVFKYFNEITFNNPKHTKRFINISNLNS